MKSKRELRQETNLESPGSDIRSRNRKRAYFSSISSVDLLTSRTGGAYIPPAKLRIMQAQITDKSSAACQRIAWEALKKSIHGHINKINTGSIHSRKCVRRISYAEKWEIKQMLSVGCIDKSELPDFDDETGLLPKEENEEEDTEIEVVEDKPAFLQSHGFMLHDLRPVRIIKNPDGFLAQAPMMQSALAKERRELKNHKCEQEMNSILIGLIKNWLEPLHEADGRTWAANMRGIRLNNLSTWTRSWLHDPF
jgi:hypothetical protein